MTCCMCSRKTPRVDIFSFRKESRDLSYYINDAIDLIVKLSATPTISVGNEQI
jgi:hypothetical protein